MQDDLIDIYEAQSLLQAQLLSDRLWSEGIESFIDHADSPLDGLLAADQVKIVRVLPNDVPRARAIVAEFEAEEQS